MLNLISKLLDLAIAFLSLYVGSSMKANKDRAEVKTKEVELYKQSKKTYKSTSVDKAIDKYLR